MVDVINVIRKSLESEFIWQLFFGLSTFNTNELIILDFRGKKGFSWKNTAKQKERINIIVYNVCFDTKSEYHNACSSRFITHGVTERQPLKSIFSRYYLEKCDWIKSSFSFLLCNFAIKDNLLPFSSIMPLEKNISTYYWFSCRFLLRKNILQYKMQFKKAFESLQFESAIVCYSLIILLSPWLRFSSLKKVCHIYESINYMSWWNNNCNCYFYRLFLLMPV